MSRFSKLEFNERRANPEENRGEPVPDGSFRDRKAAQEWHGGRLVRPGATGGGGDADDG